MTVTKSLLSSDNASPLSKYPIDKNLLISSLGTVVVVGDLYDPNWRVIAIIAENFQMIIVVSYF